MLTPIIFIFIINCSNGMKFDGEKAYEYLKMQCNLGPRYPGSDGHMALRDTLINHMINLADTILIQDFEVYVEPDKKSLALTNIIGVFEGRNNNRSILLGAHWDTRPRAELHPDSDKRCYPIIGANDGASGVAVLMHIAEILNIFQPPLNVIVAFFDGEDWGYQGSLEYFCLGSKHFAKNLPIRKPDEAIIIDMIGDNDLRIPIERYSYRIAPELIKEIWNIANKKGYKQFDFSLGSFIYDDHMPLYEIAKIKAIVIIDFEYPNRWVNYWHTLYDTIDKCSANSLAIVGKVLLEYVYSK